MQIKHWGVTSTCERYSTPHNKYILKYHVFCVGEGVGKKDALLNLCQNYN